MDVVFTEKDKHLIVSPIGEIDHHASGDLRRKIERAFARAGAGNIVFDFSSVDFMDSSGIGLLIGRYRELSKRGGRVFAVNIGGELGRIFSVSGLAKIIPCYDSLDDVFLDKGAKV